MGGAPELDQQVADLIIVIAFVQAHPLRMLSRRLRPLHEDTRDHLPRHLEVIAVRTRHGEADGYAVTLGEEAPFGPDFPAIGRMLADLFPRQAGPWSSPHPWPAMPSQCPPWPQRPRGLAPTRPGRRLPGCAQRSLGALTPRLERVSGPAAMATSPPTTRWFEACSAFTHVTACVLATSPTGDPFHRSASANVVTFFPRFDCYRLERPVAGWELHPLKSRAFARHTVRIT
jgi:hypothetical protein